MPNRPEQLAVLDDRARSLIKDEAFLHGASDPEFAARIQDFNRPVSLRALTTVIEEAMDKFADDNVASDGWLAPRVYAALRLTQREAGQRGLWHFLAAVAYPDYVRWRWVDKKNRVAPDRFLGLDNDQALWRLWRLADMFRTGSDYTGVQLALRNQDIPNTLMSINLMHNRALALAVVRFVETYALSGDPVNLLSKNLRAAAMTRLVDEIAPAPEILDPDVVKRWLSAVPYGADLLGEDVPAPEDDAVDEAQIYACYALLEQLRDAVLGRARKGYLLLRSNPDSPWRDEEATAYHYGSRVHNYRKISPGSKALIFRDAPGNVDELIGIAEIGAVESLGNNESGQEEFVARYKSYQPLTPPIALDDKSQSALRVLRHFNARYSVNYLDRTTYESLASMADGA